MTNRGILALLLLMAAPAVASPGASASSTRVPLVAAAEASAIPDRTFLEALAKKDKDAAARLLHEDFSWIDSDHAAIAFAC